MKTWLALSLLAVLTAAGCATHEAAPPPPPASEPSVPAAPAPPRPPSDERGYTFTCDDGNRIQVRFSQSRHQATLVRNGESMVLPQQASGSGFIYGDGRTTLRGKGDELILEVGKMAPIRCREG